MKPKDQSLLDSSAVLVFPAAELPELPEGADGCCDAATRRGSGLRDPCSDSPRQIDGPAVLRQAEDQGAEAVRKSGAWWRPLFAAMSWLWAELIDGFARYGSAMHPGFFFLLSEHVYYHEIAERSRSVADTDDRRSNELPSSGVRRGPS